MPIPKRSSLLAVAAVVVACGTVTEPVCACSPAGGGTAVIVGVVTDASAAPVAGARVRLRLRQDESCAEAAQAPEGAPSHTGADGRFRHTASWSGGRKCFRLWAEPPQGSGLAASDSQDVRVDFGATVRPDSVELLLKLR